jgi:hypothetical protein
MDEVTNGGHILIGRIITRRIVRLSSLIFRNQDFAAPELRPFNSFSILSLGQVHFFSQRI